MPDVASTLSASKPPPVRLEHLDGLRGLAALYVVFAHAYMTVFRFEHGHLPRWLTLAFSWMAVGRFAVDIFIVLSGYCLMLPVVRSATGRLAGDFRGFLARRARRILPPYYAALTLSLLATAVLPSLFPEIGVSWQSPGAVLTAASLWSHLLLVHNLSPNWVGTIDYPMWSIATEWQIYFAFALILLPVWRRAGVGAMLAAALALGVSLDFFFPQACFRFLALFALGMAGAAVGFSAEPRLKRWNARLPWGLLTAALTVPFLILMRWKTSWPVTHPLPTDIVAGVIVTCLLIWAGRESWSDAAVRLPATVRLLKTGPVVTLGVFSYSLYLVHAIILEIVFQALRPLHLSAVPTFALYLGLGVSGSLLAAYAFHLVFERPFLRRRRNEPAAEVAQDAVLSPAP